MNTSFGATIPPPFSYGERSKDNDGLSSMNGGAGNDSQQSKRKTTSFGGNKHNGLQKSSKYSLNSSPNHHNTVKNQGTKPSGNKNVKPSLDEITDSRIGSLITVPAEFGFTPFKHEPRPMPKFLVDQHAQLKPKQFKQDPWDKANQEKMLQLENSIEDVTDLYETLKKMRDMERKIMENKGLVDKADSAKDLTEAIDFKGTCLDMCPIFERARRNVEYTVFSYEKDDPESKKASRSKALKVFARPAAAAAPPLPSDVRPPHILCKTLDYIVDDLLVTLPDSEGFLWDRMRSIRQDFTYQNYSGPEAVECNERIVRIHLLIIHIMGKSNVEFSLQQELEQLHKSLITLSEIYDEVRANGGSSPNEAEFRAYALLSKIRDPEYDKNIQDLPAEIFRNNLVQMALCFRRIISNSNFQKRGYLKTENCLNFYSVFFQILQSGKVPFLMGSFLELYVNEVRFYAFKALSLSINKRHKPIPREHLIKNFMFNNEEELEQFCRYYAISLTNEGVDLKTLTHHSHKLNETQPLKQATLQCVDEMLSDVSFQHLINSGRKNVDTIPSVKDNLLLPKNNRNMGMEIEGSYKSTEMDVRIKEDAMKREIGPALQNNQDTKLFHSNSNTATGLQMGNNASKTLPYGFIQKHLNPSTQIKPIGLKNENDMSSKSQPWALPSSIPPEPSSQITTNEDDKEELSYADKVGFQVLNNLKNGAISNQAPKQILHPILQTQNNFEVKKQVHDINTEEDKKHSLQLKKNKEKDAAANSVTNSIIKEVVHRQISGLTKSSLQRYQYRSQKIEKLANELYYAFLHEKIYNVILRSVAEKHYEKSLIQSVLNKWKDKYRSHLERKELDSKRKSVFKNVSRQLGVPMPKKAKIISTPRNDNTSSFVLPSSVRRDIVLSPVFDEANIFLKQAEKRKEVWDPIAINTVYFHALCDKCKCLEHPANIDIFIYVSNWVSIPNNWVINKFGITDPSKPHILEEKTLSMHIQCIDSNYDPTTFKNLQLLVFNTGVTDSNIFDLEMKLQQDGEELIKLVTGISLNTNINFSLMILYWESTESPLSETTIFKYLKLNRISKSFSGILVDISIVTINGNSPHIELENALKRISDRFNYRLTDRGKYHESLRKRRDIVGLKPQQSTSLVIDEKVRRILESEKNKLKNEEDQRNTYAHLRSHIAASPKFEKKKLPVLLSKRKDYKFKTPLAIRSFSSSSPALPSHLATKMRAAPRVPSYHGVLAGGTPSHSTNLPVVPISSNGFLNSAPDNSHLSNSSFEHPTVIHEPALYQTPINAITTAPRQHPDDSQSAGGNIHEDVLELKNLIESVKRKVHEQ